MPAFAGMTNRRDNTRRCPMWRAIALTLGAAALALAAAAEAPAPWWTLPFSLRSKAFEEHDCQGGGAVAGRGITRTGWYGDWYQSDPHVHANMVSAIAECGKIPGLRKIGYFDP